MLTGYALLDEEALVRVPDHLSFEEAASLPCAAVTAWNALTDGRGADHVIEVSGTLEQSIRSVAIEGEIAFVGLLSNDAGPAPIDPTLLFTSAAVVRTIAVGSRAQFMAMNRAIEANRLIPVIDRVFPFDAAVEAYRYYEAAQPLGKVVIAQPRGT
jgi:NADPH:quinone reductase-like Zn-dependent oxidoreductase